MNAQRRECMCPEKKFESAPALITTARAKMSDFKHAVGKYLLAVAGKLPELKELSPDLVVLILDCVVDEWFHPIVQRMSGRVRPICASFAGVYGHWWSAYRGSCEVVVGVGVGRDNCDIERTISCSVENVADLLVMLSKKGNLADALWDSDRVNLYLGGDGFGFDRFEAAEDEIVAAFTSALTNAATDINSE